MVALHALRYLSGCLLLAVTGAVVIAPDVVSAQQRRADERLALNIAAMSLDAALAEYFRATGVQLLYDAALTNGRRSTAVRGNYPPREALSILLSGTGLIARYSKSNAAIITTPGPTPNGPLVPLGRVIVRERVVAVRLSPTARMAYYDTLEEELQSYLRQDHRTDRLAFNIVVEVRIDDDGHLDRLRIDRGTGDKKTDRIVTKILTGVSVSEPPKGLVQPLLVALKGKQR